MTSTGNPPSAGGEGYLIEPELAGPTPRPVRYSAGTQRARRWLWNLLPAVLYVAYLMVTLHTDHWRELQDNGVTVAAQVISKGTDIGRGDSYRVRYVFEMHGEVISFTDTMSRLKFEAIPLGSKITVVCLRDCPSEFEEGAITPQRIRDVSKTDCLIAGLGVGAYVFIVLGAEYFYASRRRLLASGTAVISRVVERREAKNGETSLNHFVKYRYRDVQANRVWEREVSVTKGQYNLLPKGTEFTSLFEPGKPWEALPYFQLREVEVDSSARRQSWN